jgi:hypothetical protein
MRRPTILNGVLVLFGPARRALRAGCPAGGQSQVPASASGMALR